MSEELRTILLSSSFEPGWSGQLEELVGTVDAPLAVPEEDEDLLETRHHSLMTHDTLMINYTVPEQPIRYEYLYLSTNQR